MCRIYSSYVRACYRTGQRGRRVPIGLATWGEPSLHGRHLVGLSGPRRVARRRSEPACPRCGRAMIVCRDRCLPLTPGE